jgi:hypothetical protein
VERGWPIAHDPREKVREEAGGLAQERVFGLYAPELLEERKGEDLRVGELFEGGVAASARVEPVLGVVDLTEQNG